MRAINQAATVDWISATVGRFFQKTYGNQPFLAATIATSVAVGQLISKIMIYLFLGRFAIRACRVDAP